MNTARLVTVVIPTYNRSEELARCLDSLAAQTDPDFGVFVCDDGSAEDIQAVVDRFSDRLDIECQRIQNSGGPARPRNIGLANTQSEWVSFLDSDDWWEPTRMAIIKRHLTDDVDVVYHPLIERHARATSPSERAGRQIGGPLRSADPLVHMLRFGNPLPTSATSARVALMRQIGGFDERRELASVEDFDAWLRLAAGRARFRYVPDALGFYWVGEDNISAFTPRQYERQQFLFERQLELLPEAYRRCASSNFNYLLGGYKLLLGLAQPEINLRRVELAVEPVRWLKAQYKLGRHFLRSSAGKL